MMFEILRQSKFDFSSLVFDGSVKPSGHILDPDFSLDYMKTFHDCSLYGKCIGCDTKLKRDRFASENIYRSSVVIRNIQWPDSLKHKVSNDYTRKA